MTGTERAVRAKVNELAEQYTAQGFQVQVEPAPASLPIQLGGYQPDLVAQKGDRHLILEVKDSSDRVPVERYRDIAEEVGRHPGWRFLLVTLNDVESRWLPGMPGELASSEEVAGRLSRAERLLDAGDADAAFLIAWSAFEAMLRRRAEQVALPIERLHAQSILKHMYSQGELSIPQFDRAMSALRLRNDLVHGSQTPFLTEAARDLNSLLGELQEEWDFRDGNLYGGLP